MSPQDEREAERRFWLIIREPGMVPDRKGPWQLRDTAKVLREFMAANPTAFIDYLRVDSDGVPWVDHGPEVLQMTDGRSMSTGRKHNARVRALTALRQPGAEYRRGVEDAARVVDENRTDDDSMWDRAAATIATGIRLLPDTKGEGRG